MERIACYNSRSEGFLQTHPHAFVGYLTAGYPDRNGFLQLVLDCAKAGMQVLEIGYPAKNPFCDGEIIRNAHKVIDPKIACDLSFWSALRSHVDEPIWLMGYQADLLDTGMYLTLAREKLVDNLVIPDVDTQTRLTLLKELAPLEVDVMGFTGDDQSDEENDLVLSHFPLVYQRLYSGPTGVPNNSDSYLRLLHRARESAVGRVFAGFGIGTCQRAAELLHAGFDGVIIGTAIMKKLNSSRREMLEFLRALNDTTTEVNSHEVYCHI